MFVELDNLCELQLTMVPFYPFTTPVIK